MAKIGLSLKIDVTKIDRDRLFKGEKGIYLDATCFVDLGEADQYGNHGMITQSWKDQEKGEGAILGNGRIFWRDHAQPDQGGQQAPSQQTTPTEGFEDFDDDIPF